MKIAHVAPFAPNRCGLYESARDMSAADIYGGHEVYFVDAGITVNGKRENPKIGAVDNRGNFKLETVNHSILDNMDVIIMHTGISDSWLVRNQAPLIWVVHGRPLACFRPERMNKTQAYSLYNTVAGWKRTKGMLYFWNEFKPFWDGVLHGKDIVLDNPVIDENRFNYSNLKYTFQNKSDINFIVCDSEREDIDLFEMVAGIVQAAKIFKNKFKVHFFGLNMPLKNCWNIILGELKKCGGLGDVVGRVGDMEKVYRAGTCLISPNRIITRTIGESLSCGTPVISQNNRFNLMSDYTCDFSDSNDVIEAIKLFINDFDKNKIDRNKILERSKVFHKKVYSENMNSIYKRRC